MSLLDTPMDPKTNDARASTIREYLGTLLVTLWREAEGFSGKRPFGNGSWQYDVYEALIRANAVAGELDTDGCVNRVDSDAADNLICEAIREFFGMTPENIS